MTLDPKLLRQYRAPQRPPVFIREIPEPAVRGPNWLLIVSGILAGLALVAFAAATIFFNVNPSR